MLNDMPLFMQPIPKLKGNKAKEAYDRKYPDIWEEFEKLADQLAKAGHKHYGSKAIVEIIRFHRTIKGGKVFKISNDMTPYYADKFMAKYPQYGEFFETRMRIRKSAHSESVARKSEVA